MYFTRSVFLTSVWSSQYPCPNRPSVGFGRRQNQGIHQIYIIPRFSLLVASAMSLSV